MRRASAILLMASLWVPALLQAQQTPEAAPPVIQPFGEVRVRFELRDRPVAADADHFTLLRTRVGVRAAFGTTAKAVVQVQDSRAFGEESSTLADGDADSFDLHQGYLELVPELFGAPLAIRAGRQEIALGDERLVGAVGWSNIGRSFDGARLTLGGGERRWVLTGFGTTLSERARPTATPVTADREDVSFFGMYLESAVPEAWVLYDRNAEYRNFVGADRWTLGAKLKLPPASRVAASVEGAYQTGEQFEPVAEAPSTQDIGAWFFAAQAGVPFETGFIKRLGAGVDWLSGDETPGDGDFAAFNTLYGTNHKFYGYMDLFSADPAGTSTGDRGLVDGVLNAETRLGAKAALGLDLHRFWFAAERADEPRTIGWEVDATLPFTIVEGQKITLGYSAFRASEGGALIGLGEDGDVTHWAYVQASVAF